MMIQISDRVRIESGPERKHAIATKELLDNSVTHSLYQEGVYDSAGNTIVLGQEMEYLDHYGPKVFYVYEMDGTGRYLPMGFYDTAVKAANAAIELAR